MVITTTRTNRVKNTKLGDGIFSDLTIDSDPFKCVVLERAGVEIPPGIYAIEWMYSEHFQQIMPHVIVPGRTAIEQHWANWPYQLDGCQALGESEDFADDMIEESKAAWKDYIEVILNQPTLTLKVVENYGII